MNKRHMCTKDDPWTREKSRYAYHPDAKEVGDQKDGYPHGDVVTVQCPHCKIVFESELPQ